MIGVRLDKKIEQDLDLLAKKRGSTRSELVREAIVRYLEDNEDFELAKTAKSRMKSSKPLKQVRKELGLDD